MPKSLKLEMVRRWFEFTIQDCEDISAKAVMDSITEAEVVRKSIHEVAELKQSINERDGFIEKLKLEIEKLIRIQKKRSQVSHIKFGIEVTSDEGVLDEILAEEKAKKKDTV